MTQPETSTRDKILHAAMTLFWTRGIGKTSLSQVAYQAGVTRITVYRYFADKPDLVQATFLYVEQIFQEGLAELKQNPQADWVKIMDHVGERLSALPPGDAAARADELKRLYPEVYKAVQKVRVATLNSLFDELFARAKRQGLLRPGLNRPIVQAVYWELVVNFFDNPRFKSFGLSDVELYRTLTNVLLYGILKSRVSETRRRSK